MSLAWKLKQALGTIGLYKPQISSFETCLITWLDGQMREAAKDDFERVRVKSATPCTPDTLNRELLVLYMNLIIRCARSFYLTNPLWEEGMYKFHDGCYRWFIDGADKDMRKSLPLADLLVARNAEYNKAFDNDACFATARLARIWAEAITGSYAVDDEMDLITIGSWLSIFIKSTQKIMTESRQIYSEKPLYEQEQD